MTGSVRACHSTTMSMQLFSFSEWENTNINNMCETTYTRSWRLSKTSPTNQRIVDHTIYLPDAIISSSPIYFRKLWTTRQIPTQYVTRIFQFRPNGTPRTALLSWLSTTYSRRTEPTHLSRLLGATISSWL